MKITRTLLATAVLALAVSAAAAQSGGLTITVYNSAGEPLPGATVTIMHETGFVKTTAVLSDKRGLAEFPILRPGAGYSIQVSFPGFTPVVQEGLRVRINENTPLEIQMIEQVQERVRVTAERDVIDLDKTGTSTKFSDDFIADLPVPGRAYQNVLTMAPGVQDADGDGNPNVHGSRSRDFKAVVSGVSNVDPLTGQWMSQINPNSIEEMEVITSGASVEFGRAQGGFANVIQKQGSNEHEGVFEFYWRSDKLDGDGANDNSELPTQEFEVLRPSFQVSGPLLKDKLWYRFSHDFRDIEIPINVGSGTEVTKIDAQTHSDQITWQVSPRNKLSLQYQSDPYDETNRGVSSRVSAESSSRLETKGDTYSLTWTAPYSPKMLANTTVSWQDLSLKLSPSQPGQPNECITNSAFLSNAYCFNLDTGLVDGAFPTTWDDNRQRFALSSKAEIFGGRIWGMSHQFKFGMSVENERYFRNLRVTPTIFTFTAFRPEQDPTGGGQQSQGDPIGRAIVNVSVPQQDEVRATGTNWGFYAEDQFRPRQNLTITLGARVDRLELNSEGRQLFDPGAELAQYAAQLPLDSLNPGQTVSNINDSVVNNARWSSFTGFEGIDDFQQEMQQILCETAENVGNCFTTTGSNVLKGDTRFIFERRRANDIRISNTDFSPYLSVSWSPWSNNKTVFRGTARRQYNSLPLTLPLQELNPIRTNLDYEIDLQQGTAQPSRAIVATVNDSLLDRDLNTPYADEFTLSIDRELFTETGLTFTYIDRKYRDQIQDFNVNRDVGDFGSCFERKSSSDPFPVVEAPGMSTNYGTAENPVYDVSDGTWLTDAYTGDMYPDTDSGIGDGRIDDCAGDVERVPAPPGVGGRNSLTLLQRPDGISDLYQLNPYWGDIFLIGNYNSADYRAYVLEITRRQYRSWEMNASYTWSEAKGDGEDFFQELGDDPSLRNNLRGFQSTDQRHVAKLNATTITPWGVRLGAVVQWQSGTPYSLLVQQLALDTTPPIIGSTIGSGERARTRQQYVDQDGNAVQRNSARNTSYWNVDLKATKEFNLGRGLNLQLSAEIFNVLDDDTYVVRIGESGEQINGNDNAFNRFGREWTLGMKLAF